MESAFRLSEKAYAFEQERERIQAELDELYEQNGGEVTSESEEIEAKIAELEALRNESVKDIIIHSDDYAELALSCEADRKAAEASYKSRKESCDSLLAHDKALVNREKRREMYWKDNFLFALQAQETTKIGGAKTNLKHSVYIQSTPSLEVDENVALDKYEGKIVAALTNLGLPSWVKVDISVSKDALKDVPETELPLGVVRNHTQTIRIK